MAKRRGERVGLRLDDTGGESTRIQERLSLISDLAPRVESNTAHQELPLDLIVPDPVQPRRPIPDLLRLEWCQGASLGSMLQEWEEDVRSLLGYDPDWSLWLEGGEVEDITSPYPAVQLWMELVRLAGSIYQFGLERPITVFPVGDQFQILTGERRFLAFNLLHWQGYKDYNLIPAIVRDMYNPYQQAVENGVRENLNAIGVARQLALLLMALNNWEIQIDGQMGQAWYAQAIDLRLPYGKSDQVALMLGLPNQESVRRYRALLQLPGVVWNWADEFSWAEGKLRQMVKKAKGNEDVLIRMAQAAVNQELNPATRPKATDRERVSKKAQSTLSAINRVVSMKDADLSILSQEARQRLVDAARTLIQRLQ